MYTLIAGNGDWSAAIDRGSRTVFIPKSFSFTITGTDPDGVEFLNETETMAQGNGNAHKNQETVTCTFGDSFTDEDGNTFEFTGEAEVVRRP